MDNSVYHEKPPLTSEDCLYVIARNKEKFDFPLHDHPVFELNYVENAKGATRIVGNSECQIGGYDLVLITNTELPHGWFQGATQSHNIHEITIQFYPKLFSETLMTKKQFHSIREMFAKAEKGISFSLATILKVRSLLNSMTCDSLGFYTMTTFMNLLYELSRDSEMTVLSSSPDAKTQSKHLSRRITQICDYIDEHYGSMIYLKDIANVACMSEGAVSRFFKQQTGKNISNYIIEVRISMAARQLIDTNKNISEICYACGFTNISNFNRQFKRLKGKNPRDFRDLYQKKHLIV